MKLILFTSLLCLNYNNGTVLVIMESDDMEIKKLTKYRLILAITSSSAEETAIWVIWRYLLPEFDIHLHVGVLIGAMVAWGCFSIWLFLFTTHALSKQAPVGLPSMIGTRGRVAESLNPEGLVRIKGELWQAVSTEGNINTGMEIVVVNEDGLKLQVRQVGDSDAIS